MNSEENILVKFHFGALSFEINDAEKICCNFTMKIRDLVKKSKQSMSSEQLQTFKKRRRTIQDRKLRWFCWINTS